MIGTFWNMCRSCPSVPADKLYTEYRSTYRWHDFTGTGQEVIRKPPQALSAGPIQEPALPRRKKHPELAYKSHRFLTNNGTENLSDKSFSYDRARSEERWTSSREKNSRRSKSEGPQRKSAYCLINTKPIYITNPSAAFSKNRIPFFSNENKALIKSSAFRNQNSVTETQIPTTIPPKKLENRTNQSLDPTIDDMSRRDSPRTSASMSGIRNKDSNSQETVPVHGKTAELQNNHKQKILQAVRTKPEPDISNVGDPSSKYDDTDGDFKSEYKKNFQPFHRYDFDEIKGIFEKRVAPSGSYGCEVDSPSSSWYKEVVLLRQKANQYRYRGWGTELIPDHIAQLYNNQMMVWEQVSRRSTLSALSLASTVGSRNETPSKDEKENRKNFKTKSLTRARSGKSSHSTATHPAKSEKKKPSTARPETESKKGNNQVKKLEIKRSSPNRTGQQSGVGAPPTVHKALSEGSDKPKRRPRPTSLITTVPSGSKTSQSKRKEKPDDGADDSSGERTQIVKSPPEPTRVKSPEQIVIRSPEPVNWTVPLDTGKTFTVTQNVREGDLAPRSYSEVRGWTPNSAPPPAASISAPTELIDLAKTNRPEEILTK